MGYFIKMIILMVKLVIIIDNICVLQKKEYKLHTKQTKKECVHQRGQDMHDKQYIEEEKKSHLVPASVDYEHMRREKTASATAR